MRSRSLLRRRRRRLRRSPRVRVPLPFSPKSPPPRRHLRGDDGGAIRLVPSPRRRAARARLKKHDGVQSRLRLRRLERRRLRGFPRLASTKTPRPQQPPPRRQLRPNNRGSLFGVPPSRGGASIGGLNEHRRVRLCLGDATRLLRRRRRRRRLAAFRLHPAPFSTQHPSPHRHLRGDDGVLLRGDLTARRRASHVRLHHRRRVTQCPRAFRLFLRSARRRLGARGESGGVRRLGPGECSLNSPRDALDSHSVFG